MILIESASETKENAKLREERIFCARLPNILLKADSLVTCFQCVYDHRTDYSVKQMCHVVKLNRSSFYKWVNTSEKTQVKDTF